MIQWNISSIKPWHSSEEILAYFSLLNLEIRFLCKASQHKEMDGKTFSIAAATTVVFNFYPSLTQQEQQGNGKSYGRIQWQESISGVLALFVVLLLCCNQMILSVCRLHTI